MEARCVGVGPPPAGVGDAGRDGTTTAPTAVTAIDARASAVANRNRSRCRIGGREGAGSPVPGCEPGLPIIDATPWMPSWRGIVSSPSCDAPRTSAIVTARNVGGDQTSDAVTTAPADATAQPFDEATRALDAAAVRWCRLRDRGTSNEDDVLVDPADLPMARRALAAAGWRERPHPGHGSHRAFHHFDPASGRWSKLDLVTALDFGRWQEWPSGLAAGCLARNESGADGRALVVDDAFWTLLLHELLDRPGTPPRRIDRLRQLAAGARDDGAPAEVVRPWLPRSWTPTSVIAAAAAGDVDRLVGLGVAMNRHLGRRPGAIARRLVAQILRWLDKRDPPFVRAGRTIALLGPDGAGKSALTGLVGVGGPMPIRSVYLGLYGGSRARQRARRLPGLGLARRLTAMWRGWLIAWWHARRGRLVLLDRHPYDARLADSRPRSLTGRLRRALLGHALPAPDVVIILDAPAEVLYSRKPEHTVERSETQRRRYLALAADIAGSLVVDASAPLDEVARTITTIAWRLDDP